MKKYDDVQQQKILYYSFIIVYYFLLQTNNGSLEDIRAKANALAIQLRKRTSFSSRFMSLPGFLMSIVIAILAAYLFDGIRQRVGVDGSGTDPDFMTSNL